MPRTNDGVADSSLVVMFGVDKNIKAGAASTVNVVGCDNATGADIADLDKTGINVKIAMVLLLPFAF